VVEHMQEVSVGDGKSGGGFFIGKAGVCLKG